MILKIPQNILILKFTCSRAGSENRIVDLYDQWNAQVLAQIEFASRLNDAVLGADPKRVVKKVVYHLVAAAHCQPFLSNNLVVKNRVWVGRIGHQFERCAVDFVVSKIRWSIKGDSTLICVYLRTYYWVFVGTFYGRSGCFGNCYYACLGRYVYTIRATWVEYSNLSKKSRVDSY